MARCGILLVGLGALSAGCPVSEWDGVAGPPAATPGLETEPSIAIAKKPEAESWNWLYSNRLVVAYIDETGWSQPFPGHDPLRSLAGYATSDDHGIAWTRHSPIPAGSCNDNGRCVYRLGGDPWLATAGSRVLLACLADTVEGPLDDSYSYETLADDKTRLGAIAVAVSEDGGKTFGEPKIVSEAKYADKDTLDARGNLALLAHLILEPYRIQVTLTQDAGDSWETPALVQNEDGTVLLPRGAPQIFKNPIVRIVDATNAYLFVQDVLDSPVEALETPVTYDYDIFRLHRDDVGMPWKAHRIFQFEGDHFPVYEGALPEGATERNRFKNKNNADFEIRVDDKAKTAELWMAHSVRLENAKPVRLRPAVVVWNCTDSFDADPPACTESSGWNKRDMGDLKLALQFDADGEADQIQPDLTLLPGSNEVRVSWFRYGVPWNPRGVRREGAVGWGNYWPGGPPTIITKSAATANELCPHHGGSMGDWIGDYAASVALPPDAQPWGAGRHVVTAFPYTRAGCENAEDGTRDLHVEAAVW